MTTGGFQVGPYQTAYQQFLEEEQAAQIHQSAVLIPVVTHVHVQHRPYRPSADWSWLQSAYNAALAESRQLGFEHGFEEGYRATAGEEEMDVEDLSGLDPDEELFGKRKKRKRRSE